MGNKFQWQFIQKKIFISEMELKILSATWWAFYLSLVVTMKATSIPLDPAVIWLLLMPALLPSTTAQSCPITLGKLSSATLASSQHGEHMAGSRELTGDMQHGINLGMTGIHSCHWHTLSCCMPYHVIIHHESVMACSMLGSIEMIQIQSFLIDQFFIF